ncbi:hypothetical protein L1987_79444 [Smallanthus sonchifolius]|uniref:Uncharacterized protein n=1 Tax=Smallanthus sonchifolius TaxID=185202 RepID=A0ACB8ZGI5_9ASTR|nr:hypothetical protein L1987_79444 [Smallanthus sonchifolius]
MALPLGKLTIIIGAGLVGSVLAKEGRIPGVGDLLSGASKVLKLIKHDEKAGSSPKPRNDSLMAQVNSLRQELQLLASNRHVTIVTSTSSGTRKYGLVVIVVVVGYGYAWWKGWKLPDMMFATKRSLSDATNAVAKQLENVYSSLAATKKHLSSRIDRVDCSLDEFAEVTASTKEEVSSLRGNTEVIALDVQKVHDAVYTLETKLSRIEWKQDDTNLGVASLLRTAITLENQAFERLIQANPSSSSRPALPSPQRTMSLPPVHLEEPQSSPRVSPGVKRPLGSSVSASASGLKALQENSEILESEDTSLNSGVFGRTFSNVGAVFSRNRPPNGK